MSKTKAKQRVRYFMRNTHPTILWRVKSGRVTVGRHDSDWTKSFNLVSDLKRLESCHIGSFISPTKARALFPRLFKGK